MIGNAVPVNLAKFLANSIKEQLKANENKVEKPKSIKKVKEALAV